MSVSLANIHSEPPNKVLTIADVAMLLGLSKGTVSRAAERGDLTFWRTPGGHRRFLLRDVKLFQCTHMTPGPRGF